jgi:glycosyltransferase involved in cell wall biosynthesis
MKPAHVSLVMIARDEAHHIALALGSVAGLFGEMIVADTGSTDDTAAVAARSGATVVSIPWEDDFGGARNRALDLATGDYAFILDCDEVLHRNGRNRLRAILRSPSPGRAVAYHCDVISRLHDRTWRIALPRLFPLRPDVRYAGRVHEDVAPSLRAAGIPLIRSGVEIHHSGYLDPDVAAGKVRRNKRLASLERGYA